MRRESRTTLDSIFQRHEAAKSAASTDTATRSGTEEQFYARFCTVRASILRPVLEEFGEFVKSRGYDYEITEENRDAARESGTYASITVHLIAKRQPGTSKREYPAFRFTCLSSDERVRLFESTTAPGEPGHSRIVGEVPLAELTPEFVERQLVALARHVFH